MLVIAITRKQNNSWEISDGEIMSNKAEDFDETCSFCLIAHKETKIIKQNDELVCFRDVCPVAPHHYLVIPREHIHSCRSLSRRQVELVERMAELGRAVLYEQGIKNMEDVRLGFHKPPFISVGHLHLHVLAPASRISQSMLCRFTPGTDCFITEESLRNQLQKKIQQSHKLGNCFGVA